MQVTYLLFLLTTAASYGEGRTFSREEVFLTETFGLLTERERSYGLRDILKNYGTSFKDNGATAWQCFNSKKIKISCFAIQNSESEGCTPQIIVNEGNHTNLYLYRKGFGNQYCKDQMSILRKILKAKQVCIAGEFVGDYFENNNEVSQWQFSRMKSKTGDFCVLPDKGWGCFYDW